MAWLWYPPDNAWQALTSMLVPGFLLLFVIAALWAVRAPGEVGARERRRLLDPVAWDWRVWLVRSVPVLVIVGTFLLFFPFAAPRIVLLSSAARGGIADTEWNARWDALVSHLGLGEETVYLDASILVTQVCRDLETQKPDWHYADPEDRNAISRAAQTVLKERGPHLPVTSNPRKALGSAEYGLEPWVVESVEMAVLQGLARQWNVARVVALVVDRPTRLGYAWDNAEARLSRRTRASSHFERIPLQRLVTLEYVLRTEPEAGASAPSGGLSLWARLSAAPTRPPGTSTTFLEVTTPTGTTVRSNTITIDHGLSSRMLVRRFDFTGLAAGVLPAKVRQITNTRVVLTRSIRTVRKLDTIFVDSGDVAAWQNTFQILRTNPAFATWREGLVRRGFDFSLSVQPTPAGGPHERSVVLHHADGVWVYHGTHPLNRLAHLTVPVMPQDYPWTASEPQNSPHACRWDALSLNRHAILPPVGQPSLALVAGKELGADLRSGREARTGSGAPLILWRRLVPSTMPGLREVITYCAVRPEEHDVLFDASSLASATLPADFEFERFLAYWTTLIEAIEVAQAGIQERAEAREDDHPIPLLTATQSEGLRATSIRWTLLPLIVALCIYALFVVSGVRRVPEA